MSERQPPNPGERPPRDGSASVGESAPVNAERAGDREAAAEKLEQMRQKAEHHKTPNFFQEHGKKLAAANKEKTLPRAIGKVFKESSLLMLGGGIAFEAGAVVAGEVGSIFYPPLASVAFKILAPTGLALASPWIIGNILEQINKFVGGSKISIGGGGGGHGGGGGGGGH